MTVAFNLTVFGWHISTFNIRIDIDPGITTPEPAVDRMVKRISRRWVRSMAS
jgi:hypothetical protein